MQTLRPLTDKVLCLRGLWDAPFKLSKNKEIALRINSGKVFAHWGFATLLAVSGFSTVALAHSDATPPADSSGGPSTPGDSKAPAASNGNALQTEGRLARWFEFNTFTFALRYRSVDDSDGVHTYDQAQQRSLLDGKFKFDKDGKYSIGFHFSSGQYFDWAYADFIGGGTTEANRASIPRLASLDDQMEARGLGVAGSYYPSGGWTFLPRQLYFDAKPVSGVEFQYGSIGINRGMNTEITSYDDDGYLSGGRIIIRKPKKLYFDEVSVTYAYLGDIYTPNFFARGESLAHSNYHQFLVRKKLTPWLELSADYTQDLAHTVREAVYIKTKRAKIADGVRVEAYERTNRVFEESGLYPAEGGFAITVDKSIKKRIDLQAGFADIDYNYDAYSNSGGNAIWGFALNGDQYGMGKRPFVRATIKVTPYLSIFAFYTHLVDYNYDRDGFVWDQMALNTGVQIDFKKLLKLGSAH
jgi:hypothetical protein